MDKSLVAYTGLGLAFAGFLAGVLWRADRNVSELDFYVGMHAESRPANGGASATGDPGSLIYASPSTVVTADTKSPEPRGGCFDVPVIRGAEVVGLGAYEGVEEPSLSFADEDHEVGRIVVQADPGGPPVLLVLSAYDPVVWDFGDFPADRVRGVLIYGYAAQGLVNLPQGVPVRFVTRTQGAGPCGSYAYAYKAGANLEKLNAQVQAVLGVEMSRFYGAYSPRVLNVDGGAPRPIDASPIRKSSIIGALVEATGFPRGEAGLKALIDQGDLRPATQADVNAWNAAAASHYRTSRLTPYQSERLSAHDALVVLRKTSLPRGMYGAHSREFILPAGVPLPGDPGSHNSYYLISSGTCTGPACD